MQIAKDPKPQLRRLKSAGKYMSPRNADLIHILQPGFTQLNRALTLRASIYKRNRNAPFYSKTPGKSRRYFVLDFQCQKFYYKSSEEATEFKYLCDFSQIREIRVV